MGQLAAPGYAGCCVLVSAMLLLNACGGGGEPTTPVSGGVDAATQEYQRGLAQKAYDGVPRTPADFYSDPPLPGAAGTVATTHLKNSDVSAPSGGTSFELCSDDMAQAIAWSELRATFQAAYSDMVDITGNARAFEVVRVPRVDSTMRLRHRVFKCSYLDRSGSDLPAMTGAAGAVNMRPIAAQMLKDLSEYLWQFTSYNNASTVVLSSAATTGVASGQIGHTIEMVQLTRAATSADCDRLDVLRWTHTAATDTGALQRRLETAATFRARRDNGVVQLCL